MKKLRIWYVYFILLIYYEIIFRIFSVKKFFDINFLAGFFYLLFFSFILTLGSFIFNERCNKTFFYLVICIIAFIYGFEIIYHYSFDVYFSLDSIYLANQLLSFKLDVLIAVVKNVFVLAWILLPIFLLFYFQDILDFKRVKFSFYCFTIISLVISYLLFSLSLYIDKNKIDSMYQLYFKKNNNSLSIEYLGVLPSLLIESRKIITNFEEEIVIDTDEDQDDFENVEYQGNLLKIDFNNANLKTSDPVLKKLNDYFNQADFSNKNKYTGMFQKKNFIFIIAESFNYRAIDPTLTPNLYRLSTQGFVFENFYSPLILSTIGGEFMGLTGLYPNLKMLGQVWRKGTNYFPYGLGNVFKDLGYQTFAYHNHYYNFQNRDLYLKSQGFDNYLGCNNGLEKIINCNIWPESDEEMIKATIKDYVNSERPFMTYYMTVSGHKGYINNAMARKHYEKVKGLFYSENVKGYLATQIELDQALGYLLEQLEKENKLDDTVIALIGDHYPYGLSDQELVEISDPSNNDIFSKDKSSFILWNNQMEKVVVSKYGGQMDVLPTILNLFGYEYDSRLLIGKDLLSNNEGLVIFNDKSWITDQGYYQAATKQFIAFENKLVDQEYNIKINQKVNNQILVSQYLLEKDYFKFIWEEIK